MFRRQSNRRETSIDSDNVHGNEIWQRIKFELRGNIFSLEEPNGLYIDVANSFAPPYPRFRHAILLLRAVILVWSLSSLILSVDSRPDEEGAIYLAYLTHLGLIITIIYQVAACMVTFHRSCLIQPNIDSQHELSTPVKIMWFLYFLSVPNEIIITLLYWTLDYPTKDGPVSYTNVFVHGILALLLLIDGNLIARIPLKMKQIVAIEIYATLYLIWTVIHAFSGVGKGDHTDEYLLYSVIDWKDKPIKTLITSFVILFVACPIVFTFAWFLSLAGEGFTFNGGRRQLHNS